MNMKRRTFLASTLAAIAGSAAYSGGAGGVDEIVDIEPDKVGAQPNPLYDWSTGRPSTSYAWRHAEFLQKATGRDAYIVTTGQSSMGVPDWT